MANSVVPLLDSLAKSSPDRNRFVIRIHLFCVKVNNFETIHVFVNIFFAKHKLLMLIQCLIDKVSKENCFPDFYKLRSKEIVKNH